jgi:hypothetical protein
MSAGAGPSWVEALGQCSFFTPISRTPGKAPLTSPTASASSGSGRPAQPEQLGFDGLQDAQGFGRFKIGRGKQRV